MKVAAGCYTRGVYEGASVLTNLWSALSMNVGEAVRDRGVGGRGGGRMRGRGA